MSDSDTVVAVEQDIYRLQKAATDLEIAQRVESSTFRELTVKYRYGSIKYTRQTLIDAMNKVLEKLRSET